MTLSPASSVRAGMPLGLTGAQAATRYVGATASGAPASGTFAVGDFCIDQTGKVFVCTAAGSPGTWAEIGGGGGETALAYAQFTANVPVDTGNADIPNLVVATGARTYEAVLTCIEIGLSIVEPATTDFISLTLWDDATRLGDLTSVALSVTRNVPVTRRYYFTPAAGSHTYKLMAYRGASNGTIYAGDGTSGQYMPGYMRITTADSV